MKTNGPFEYHKSPEKSSDHILPPFSFLSLSVLTVTIFFQNEMRRMFIDVFSQAKVLLWELCLAFPKATRATIASPIGGLPCPCLRRRAVLSHRSPNWPRRPEKKSVNVGQKLSTTSWSPALVNNVIMTIEPAHYGRCRCETTTWVGRLGSCAGGLGRAGKLIFTNYCWSWKR